jgi:DNA-binding response OmpR family regulator
MSKSQTVLIVEDEATIREVVRKYLELEGYTVLEAESGAQAMAILRKSDVDLVIMDVMLPELDGFTLTRAIRGTLGSMQLSVRSDTPIIMLTSRSGEGDRIAGFELGVDDYVVKPFSPRELMMRVKAVLRRALPAEVDKTLLFPHLQIDPARRVVLIDARPLTLTVKEFELLYFLAQHPRQVFSRSQLLDRVWGYEFYGDESTVTVHIRRLREKIETDPANPLYIQTVWGVGYKFEAGSE